MTPQTKSAYRLICERECEWCAKGVPSDGIRHWQPRRFLATFRQFQAQREKAPLCTAPSMDDVIEQQAKEIEELRADKAILDWLEGQRKVKGLWITSSNGVFDVPASHAVVSREKVRDSDDAEYIEWTGETVRDALRDAMEELQ